MGMRVEKPSSMAFIFQVFSRKTEGQALLWLCSELYNSYNHAHAPGQHMWLSLGSRVQALGQWAQLQVLHNSGSRMFTFRVKTQLAPDSQWRNLRRKKERESSNTKSARVCALTGSVQRRMAEGWKKVSAPCWNWTRADLSTSTQLNDKASGSCQSTEKNGIQLDVFCNRQLLF